MTRIIVYDINTLLTVINKMKTRSKELVKIYKKQNNLFKLIYIHNKTYKRKLFTSLMDAITYSINELGASKESTLLSISL